MRKQGGLLRRGANKGFFLFPKFLVLKPSGEPIAISLELHSRVGITFTTMFKQPWFMRPWVWVPNTIVCIMRSSHLGFAKQFFLLIQFLPHHKMYFYPNFGLSLRGPFDQSPWTREVSVAMSQRIIPFAKVPLMCQACDSPF